MRIEAAIQRAFLKWIKDNYSDVMATPTLNENSRYDDTICVGLPDVIIFRRGHVLFLELKTKKGRLSPSQKEWAEKYHQRLACSIFYHAVAYGLKDARETFLLWYENSSRQ